MVRKLLFLILFAAFISGCTREAKKKSRIAIRFPSAAANLNYPQSVSAFSTKWQLSDPSVGTDINCYAVVVTLPEAADSANVCTNISGTKVATPSLIAGGFPAGSSQEIDVPSGTDRIISLVGFHTDDVSLCHDISKISGGFDTAHFSAPYFLDKVTKDLAPGVVELTLEVPAVLSAPMKFEDCAPFAFSSPGISGTVPLTLTSIAPDSGPAAGGTAVTLTGTGFDASTTATIGGSACTSLVVVTQASLTCFTPALAPGTYDVAVFRGVATDVLLGEFQSIASASLSISDPAHNFGTLANGATSDKTFTITNNGGISASALNFTSLTSPYSLIGGTCGSTLAAAATCTKIVRFAPTSAGASSGSLTLTYDDVNTVGQTTTRGFSGNGALPAALAFSPVGPHDFGNLTTGTSGHMSFTVSNSGGVTATALGDSGLAAPYTFKGGPYPGVGGNCIGSLAAGASCTIVLTFAPTLTGATSDSLDLAYNDGASGQTASLGVQGAGISPALLTISGASPFDFSYVRVGDTVTNNFTITNTGSTTATGISASGLTAPFSVGGTCVASLAPASGCTLTVTYAPTTSGPHSQTLAIAYNDGAAAQTSSRVMNGTGENPSATISGAPSGTSNVSSLSVNVGGTEVISYQYWVGTGTTCGGGYSGLIGEATDITASISGIADGSVILCVLGQATGGTIQASAASTTWTKDTIPPTAPVITINSGATYTNLSSVSLALSASGAADMYIANDSGCSTGSWETFNSTKAGWTVGQANGTVTVYAKFRDTAGNETACVSDTIIHDNLAPAVTFSSPAAGTEVGPSVTISGTCENGSSVNFAGAGVSGTPSATCTSGFFSGTITLTANTGIKVVSASQTDAAGNMATASMSLFRRRSWMWKMGSSLVDQAGVYNTLGTIGSPGGRNGAALVAQGTNLWMYGGHGYAASGSGTLDDLWKFDGTNWSYMKGGSSHSSSGTFGTQGTESGTDLPPSMTGSVLWLESGDAHLGHFGGASITSDFHNAFHRFNLSNANWTWLLGGNAPGNAGSAGTPGTFSATYIPNARGKFTSAGNASAVYLFGGLNGSNRYSDTWKYNKSTSQWGLMKGPASGSVNLSGVHGTMGTGAPGNRPGARSNAMSWVDSSGNFWVFGGYGYDSAGTLGYLSDLFVFNGTLWTWVAGSNTVAAAPNYQAAGLDGTTANPGARMNGYAWAEGNNLWLYGGEDAGAATRADLWMFNISTGNWVFMGGPTSVNEAPVYGTRGTSDPANWPGGRAGGPAVLHGNYPFIFGGYSNAGLRDDLWKLVD